MRAWRVLAILGVSFVALFIGLLVAVGMGWVHLFYGPGEGDPEFEYATRSVSDKIDAGEQIRATIEIEIDPDDVAPFDTLTAALVIDPSGPDTAVVGELRAEASAPFRPYFARPPRGQHIRLDPDQCRTEAECRLQLDLEIGNLGTSAEEWEVIVTLGRDADTAGPAELRSPTIRIAELSRGYGLWAPSGPVLIGAEVQETVAYALAITTSMTDPEEFDVFVIEPRQDLATRTKRAVIGPSAPVWALPNDEPPYQSISSQASCNTSGCKVDVVTIFVPGQEGDWWIPFLAPKPSAAVDLVKESSVTIDTRRLEISEFAGELEAGNHGSMELEIESPPDSREALVHWFVYPSRGGGPRSGTMSTNEQGALRQYEWFPLECTDQCRGSVVLSWHPAVVQPSDGLIAYYGFVIGGEGEGVGASIPPTVRVVAGP